jgi:class 3 adenylate cyclase
VEELVELSLRGKDRLASALVHQDEAGMARMDRAAAAFGRVRKAGDLRPSAAMDSPWYSKPRPDWDGKVRRVSPVRAAGDGSSEEHVIYAALKSRFSEPDPAYTDSVGAAYQGAAIHTPGAFIPLDRSGAVLLELARNAAFRRLPLEIFLKYEELDYALQGFLREADSLGIYSGIDPENSPVNLFEYALSLRDELLGSAGPGGGEASPEVPGGEKKARWVHARSGYFAGLDNFLSGPAEANLVAGCEKRIASGNLKEGEAARLAALRDALIRSFGLIRESWAELRDLRLYLGESLGSSFAILGPAPSAEPAARFPGGGWGLSAASFAGFTSAELSAALADAILSGRAIDPGQTRFVLFWSLLAVLASLLIIFRLPPFTALAAGLALSLLLGAGFSWDFIVTGYWIDPLIPASGSLAGTLFVFFASQVIIRRGGRHFLLAYGPYVGRPCLKQLIRRGRPLTTELIQVRAAVVAVRKLELLSREDRGNPLAGAQAAETFRKEVSHFFKKAGGIVIGCDGDLVLGCFGSPLERIALGGMKADLSSGADPYARHAQTPAARAAAFIAEVLAGPADAASWRFGVDSGECAFGYMPVSGYSAYGRPVVRSRILSSLAPRYNVRVVISAAVSESLPDMPVRKLNILKEQGGSEGEAFYQLVMKN